MNTSTPILHTQESVMGNIINGLPAKGFNSMSGAKQFSIDAAFGRACEELAEARNTNASAMAQLKLAIEDFDKSLVENARLLSRMRELEGALRRARGFIEAHEYVSGLKSEAGDIARAALAQSEDRK